MGSAWVNFNIRFYLVALVFIIFEVEIAFVFPVAAVFRRWVEGGVGLFALVEVLMSAEDDVDAVLEEQRLEHRPQIDF